MKKQTKYFLLEISPLFFACIALLMTFSVDSTVLIALLSSALHECGHLAVLLYFGSEIKSVTLSFYGMKIVRQGEMTLSFKKETAVCLAGVAVNLTLFFIFLILNILFKKPFFIKISAVNLILGAFNSLPVFSFDGGRVLECVLKNRYDLEKSERILKKVSVLTILPITAFGIFLFIKNGNFTLLLCAVYMLVSSILK